MNICNRLLIIFMLELVALSGCPKKEPLKTKIIPVVIEANKPLKKRLETIIKAHPEVKNKYHIQIIKPNPNIDYKIVRVKPDPNVDYKIIIIDPRTGKKIPKLTNEMSRDISKLLRNQKK